MSNEQLFALTIKEPWLWAILHGGKRIENRSYSPPARFAHARIALHASKSYDQDGADFLWHRNLTFTQLDLRPGCIVATALIDGCTMSSDDPWFFGPFGWLLSDIRILMQPLPARGMLGLWPVNDVLVAKINEQLRQAV